MGERKSIRHLCDTCKYKDKRTECFGCVIRWGCQYKGNIEVLPEDYYKVIGCDGYLSVDSKKRVDIERKGFWVNDDRKVEKKAGPTKGKYCTNFD